MMRLGWIGRRRWRPCGGRGCVVAFWREGGDCGCWRDGDNRLMQAFRFLCF